MQQILLEMGKTASTKLNDLRSAGSPWALYGFIVPIIHATMGIIVAHLYSKDMSLPFEVDTYALFAVFLGAASSIAVSAIQRLAISEASPIHLLEASLGSTFSYDVTIGISASLQIARVFVQTFPEG